MNSKKQFLSAFFALTVLTTGTTVFAAEPAKDAAPAQPAAAEASPAAEPASQTPSLPNPIAKYDTINKLNTALGFRALYVPRIYGYECTSMYIIGGDLAQLSFKSNIDSSTLLVRTARRDSVGTDEISGYYGVNWTEKIISRTKTLYGTAPNGNTVVCWVVGKYAFSVSMANLDEATFLRQMKGLVRTSEQRYNRRARKK